MTITLSLVVYLAVVTWLLIMVAAMVRSQAWTTHGRAMAFGNRDAVPEATGFAGRAERTARNTLENFILFAVLALVASAANVASARVVLGAQVFFWARMVYIPIYYLGVPYVRTLVWTVGIVGLAMMVIGLL
jgi:uncharacterized MAPEG superfamily protein